VVTYHFGEDSIESAHEMMRISEITTGQYSDGLFKRAQEIYKIYFGHN
jgi:hypothetical protein